MSVRREKKPGGQPCPVYVDWMNPATGVLYLVGEYGSIKDAAEDLCVSERTISNSVSGKSNMYTGCRAHYGSPCEDKLIKRLGVMVTLERGQ